MHKSTHRKTERERGIKREREEKQIETEACQVYFKLMKSFIILYLCLLCTHCYCDYWTRENSRRFFKLLSEVRRQRNRTSNSSDLSSSTWGKRIFLNMRGEILVEVEEESSGV